MVSVLKRKRAPAARSSHDLSRSGVQTACVPSTHGVMAPRRSPLLRTTTLALLALTLFGVFVIPEPAAAARIAFTSFRSGSYDVYTVRPDGSGLRRVTRHVSQDQEPSA